MLCQRTAMTRLAGDDFVRAIKLETRLRIVVEHPLVPVHRVVAQRAPVTKALVMCIGISMARHALLGRIAEHTRVMTLGAVNTSVLAQ